MSAPDTRHHDNNKLEAMVSERTREIVTEKELFESIVDAIPCLVWSASADGSIDFLNRRLLEYNGLTHEQVSGWGWRVAIHPEDLPGMEKHWRSLIAAQIPGEYEVRLRRYDGAYRWFLLRGVPLRMRDGSVRWYGSNTDIDDRRQAEDKLYRSEHLARGQLEALTGTLSALTRESVPEKFLEHVLLMIGRQLGAESVSMWEWKAESGYAHLIAECAGGHLIIRTQSEIDSSARVGLTTHPHPIWDEFFRTGRHCVIGAIDPENIRIRSVGDSADQWHPWSSDPAFNELTRSLARKLHAAGVTGTLAVPMFLHGKVSALISIRFKHSNPFRTEEIELARALTHQAMLAVQWIRLSSLRQEAAILAERARLTKVEEDRLRRSEAYQAAAQQLSATGSFGWNVETGECVWSDEMHRLFGSDHSISPTMDTFFCRVHPDDLQFARTSFELAAHGEGIIDCQLRLVVPDAGIRNVYVRARPARASASHELVGAVMDITERTRAADALRASEHLARGQLAALTQTLALLSRETDLTQLPKHVLSTISAQLNGHSVTLWERNDTTLRLVGIIEAGRFYTGTEARYFDGTLPVIEPAPPLWIEGLQSGQPLVIENVHQDTSRIVLSDGRTAPWPIARLNLSFAALKKHLTVDGVRTLLIAPMLMGGDFAGIVGIRFTTVRSFRQEELELVKALGHQAMLAMKLMRLSEHSRTAAIVAERNRLARELHDTLAQGFTGVIVQLEAAEDAWTRGLSVEFGTHLSHARTLARESLNEARRTALALRPQALAEKGVGGALQDLLTKMTSGTSLRANFTISGQPWPLPDIAEENLLRIGQEVLTNMLRHSHASRFEVVLSYQSDEIRLEMRDDGSGFDASARNEGLGLVGIKERAAMLHGEASIISALGQGTMVVVRLPRRANNLGDA